LEWSDVDDHKVYLRAAHSKNRKPVTVPLNGEIAEIIDRRRAARVLESANGISLSCFVFHRGDGAKIGDLRKSWATACNKAEVTGKLFHDLRRTAARNLVAAGTPESVAMSVTGHVTNAMFKRYSITSEQQKEQALHDLGEYHRRQDERRPAPKMVAP
jgi:integrase